MPLTNTQYDQIMRNYQQRQLDRQHLISRRKQEIRQTAPQIPDLDARIAHLSVQQAHLLLDGDPSALKNLKEELRRLSAQREQILTSHGYPADYLTPPYTCPDCRDTGYIGRKRCHCLTQAAIDLVYAQSNLTDVLKEENVSAFSLDYYADDIFEPNTDISARDAAKNARQKCQNFVANFDNTFENILLFGDTGVGKTFLTHCIAGALLEEGHSVIYFSAHRFFECLAQTAFGRDAQSKAENQNIFDCDLLIIDDLGTEMTNTFTASQFFVCLNERLRSKKSTLISTNLGLSNIASIYSERVFSRISNSFILLHLFGQDIRIQKKLRGNERFPCQEKRTML